MGGVHDARDLRNNLERFNGVDLAEWACVAFQVNMVAMPRKHLHRRVELKCRPVEQTTMLRSNLVIVHCGSNRLVPCGSLPR